MVKTWFSKGTNKNGKKMVKTFFLATKPDGMVGPADPPGMRHGS